MLALAVLPVHLSIDSFAILLPTKPLACKSNVIKNFISLDFILSVWFDLISNKKMKWNCLILNSSWTDMRNPDIQWWIEWSILAQLCIAFHWVNFVYLIKRSRIAIAMIVPWLQCLCHWMLMVNLLLSQCDFFSYCKWSG